MDSALIPYKLDVHPGHANPFFRDERGNVWYREVTVVPNRLLVTLSIIRRHDGINSPASVLNRGYLGLVMPGDLISIDECPSYAEIEFILAPKREDGILAELRSDPEKVDLVSQDGTKFAVSKSLLLLTQHFRTMFADNFREALNNVIKLDFSSSTVAAFVEYLEKDTINCGLADLVRLGQMVHPWEMPTLLKRIELEICARFDQAEPEDDWNDVFDLNSLLKSRWIALACGYRIKPAESQRDASSV